jgi:Cu+-exporting ATPase
VELADHLRPEAAEVVRMLQARGLHLGICSGDREEVAAHVAGQLGVAECHARCTPETKPRLIAEAQARGAVVGMVGDGVNDAPALAVADVGFAMSGGSDLAKESSDVTLIGDDLTRLPWLMHLASATRRTIDQNLVWAFGYNAVAIAIAFFGHLHPLIAAIAMLGSSLMVTGNSLRLTREGSCPLPRVVPGEG